MILQGVRVHLAGTAAKGQPPDLLASAHQFVRELVRGLIAGGGGLVLGAGGEPKDPDTALPLIFDWSALAEIGAATEGTTDWPEKRPARFVTVASQAALGKIPEERQELWGELAHRTDFSLKTLPPGWRMGGALRQEQVRHGDVLVAISGGAGVEQLAELYVDDGKAVVPLRAELGAINADGNGGSNYLHKRALAEPGVFFELREAAGAEAARLNLLDLGAGRDPASLAEETLGLIADMQPPRAFYVRLLAVTHPDFQAVEGFFRTVVDPVVADVGYRRHEIGSDAPIAGFMNAEIFEGLHRAGVAVVDLTGVRPNCMMELGYALGRGRRVIVTAKVGTSLPFDTDKIPTHLWSADAEADRLAAFRDWFERYIDMPRIVR